MGDTIIMQGPGYTIAQTDEAETALPYGPVDRPNGDRNYGFVDLRDHPELAAMIPEAQSSDGMQAILRAVNAPGFRFMTLGCARGLFLREPKENRPTHHFGSYIQVAYRDPALNTDPARFIALAQAILHGISGSDEHHIGFEMIVEPLRTFFGHDNCFALMVKASGYGNSEDAASAAWEHAARAVAVVFDDLRSKPSPLSASPPDGGAPS